MRLKILFIISLWFVFSGQLCTKEIVYGKDYHTTPLKANFTKDKAGIFQATKKTLERFGYEIQIEDEFKGSITTGWRPVETDSHYFNLFGRKDYGATDGAYYTLTVDLVEEGSAIKVLVGTTIKSIAGRMETTGKVERRVLRQLEDYLRSPQIHMSNVGVKDK